MKIHIIDTKPFDKSKLLRNSKSEFNKLKNTRIEYNILKLRASGSKLQDFWKVLSKATSTTLGSDFVNIDNTSFIYLAVNNGQKLVTINLERSELVDTPFFQLTKVGNADNDSLLLTDFNSRKLYIIKLQYVRWIKLTWGNSGRLSTKHCYTKVGTLLREKKIILTRRRIATLKKMYNKSHLRPYDIVPVSKRLRSGRRLRFWTKKYHNYTIKNSRLVWGRHIKRKIKLKHFKKTAYTIAPIIDYEALRNDNYTLLDARHFLANKGGFRKKFKVYFKFSNSDKFYSSRMRNILPLKFSRFGFKGKKYRLSFNSRKPLRRYKKNNKRYYSLNRGKKQLWSLKLLKNKFKYGIYPKPMFNPKYYAKYIKPRKIKFTSNKPISNKGHRYKHYQKLNKKQVKNTNKARGDNHNIRRYLHTLPYKASIAHNKRIYAYSPLSFLFPDTFRVWKKVFPLNIESRGSKIPNRSLKKWGVFSKYPFARTSTLLVKPHRKSVYAINKKFKFAIKAFENNFKFDKQIPDFQIKPNRWVRAAFKVKLKKHHKIKKIVNIKYSRLSTFKFNKHIKKSAKAFRKNQPKIYLNRLKNRLEALLHVYVENTLLRQALSTITATHSFRKFLNARKFINKYSLGLRKLNKNFFLNSWLHYTDKVEASNLVYTWMNKWRGIKTLSAAQKYLVVFVRKYVLNQNNFNRSFAKSQLYDLNAPKGFISSGAKLNRQILSIKSPNSYVAFLKTIFAARFSHNKRSRGLYKVYGKLQEDYVEQIEDLRIKDVFTPKKKLVNAKLLTNKVSFYLRGKNKKFTAKYLPALSLISKRYKLFVKNFREKKPCYGLLKRNIILLHPTKVMERPKGKSIKSWSSKKIKPRKSSQFAKKLSRRLIRYRPHLTYVWQALKNQGVLTRTKLKNKTNRAKRMRKSRIKAKQSQKEVVTKKREQQIKRLKKLSHIFSTKGFYHFYKKFLPISRRLKKLKSRQEKRHLVIKVNTLLLTVTYAFGSENNSLYLAEKAQYQFAAKEGAKNKTFSDLNIKHFTIFTPSHLRFHKFLKKVRAIRTCKRTKLRKLAKKIYTNVFSFNNSTLSRRSSYRRFLNVARGKIFDDQYLARKSNKNLIKKWWRTAGRRWRSKNKFRHEKLKSFKFLFKKAQGIGIGSRDSYRKIKNNAAFVKLMRVTLYFLSGLKEKSLLKTWIKVSRGSNLDESASTLDRFLQTLFLRLDNFVLFLGFSPNRVMAREFVRFGGLRVNDIVITNHNYSLNANDIFQVSLAARNCLNNLYSNRFKRVNLELKTRFVQFLQINWALMVFQFVRWPFAFEISGSNKFMNLRWLRFFIRYLPSRISKYETPKLQWYKY